MLCIKLIEISGHSSAFQIWMSLPYWSVRPLLQIPGWIWWQRLLHPNEDTLTTYQVDPLLRRLSNKVSWSSEMCASFWFLFVQFLPLKYIQNNISVSLVAGFTSTYRCWYLTDGTISGNKWYVCFSQFCSAVSFAEQCCLHVQCISDFKVVIKQYKL